MATIKCPHCGGDVEVPGYDYRSKTRDWLAKKREQDPNYGKPEIIKVNGGSIMLGGQRLVLCDYIRVERLKTGWKGQAYLSWRSLMTDPTMTVKLSGNYPVDEIELGDNGPRSRVVRQMFIDAPRRPKLEFTGIGILKLPE